MNDELTWSEFQRVELRVGRVLEVSDLPEARRPAYVLKIDFGDEFGVRKSSARITDRYRPEALVGTLVVAVVNFAPKQIGSVMSECLVTGFHDAAGAVVLCRPDADVPLGARLA